MKSYFPVLLLCMAALTGCQDLREQEGDTVVVEYINGGLNEEGYADMITIAGVHEEVGGEGRRIYIADYGTGSGSYTYTPTGPSGIVCYLGQGQFTTETAGWSTTVVSEDEVLLHTNIGTFAVLWTR